MSEGGNNLPVAVDRRAVNPKAGGKPMAIIPDDYAGVVRFSVTIFESGLAPKDLKSPQAVTIVLLQGLELGLPPMMSIQRIAVINGRPAIWGDAALALVYSRGAAEDIEEFFEGEGEEFKAVCIAKRKGKPTPVRQEFSVADADRARLWDVRPMVRKYYWNKSGEREQSKHETPNDSPWYRFPKRMLQMRARGLALRDAFPDVLMGLYIAEELQGGREEDQPVVDDTPPDPRKQEITDGTTANAGGVGSGDGVASEGAGHDEAQKAGNGTADAMDAAVHGIAPAVVEADQVAEPALVQMEGRPPGDLPLLDNSDDFAAGIITRLGQLPTEQDIKDLMTDEHIWEYLEAAVFSRRTADAINDALAEAIARVTKPAADDDMPPNPVAGEN